MKTKSEFKIIKQHVEKLNLDKKMFIVNGDVYALMVSLKKAKELELSKYIDNLNPDELEDLIVNTLYK